MSEPIFKIREPDGKEYRIYADGQTEGFKEGAFIANGITILLHYAQGLTQKAIDNGLIPRDQGTSILSRWPFA
jgi:hypothetical protein